VPRAHPAALTVLHNAVVARYDPSRARRIAVFIRVAQHVTDLMGSRTAGVVQEKVAHIGPPRSGMHLHNVVLAGCHPLHIKINGVLLARAAAVRTSNRKSIRPRLFDRRLPGVLCRLQLCLRYTSIGLQPDPHHDVDATVPVRNYLIGGCPAVVTLGSSLRNLVAGEQSP